MTVCGGKTSGGGECRRPAGWGTDHVGSGRCKLHGGGKGTGRPPTHGRYSVAKRKSLQEKIDQFYTDPNAGDLRSELALLRALLQDYLEQMGDRPKVERTDISAIYGMVDSIGHLVERISKILATTALTQAELQLLQVTMIDAIGEFIPDPEQQRRFISRIFGSLQRATDPGLGAIAAEPIDIGVGG